ncbi:MULTISPECIES: protein rep [Bacillus]|uniref:protein rep n=1 Tax=Bacillus TaxID=1386 RepID=UPI001F5AF399|nr:MULTISPECIES: protein rep [Bacillus]
MNNKTNVQVWEHQKTKKAFYNGLLVCGIVWNCPVRAAKISEKRRKELQQAFNIHKSEGGYIALLTLTFSHNTADRLKEMLEKFGNATRKFMSGGAYNNIRGELGLIGRLRVFEVTYGQNGFHPHVHIALFYTNDVELKSIEKKMYFLWEKACKKSELITSFKYGLDLQDGDEAQNYLSKHGTWGLDQELSKSHIKKDTNDLMTPIRFSIEIS